MAGFPHMHFSDAYQWLLRMSAHTERHLMQVQEVRRSAGYPRSQQNDSESRLANCNVENRCSYPVETQLWMQVSLATLCGAEVATLVGRVGPTMLAQPWAPSNVKLSPQPWSDDANHPS